MRPRPSRMKNHEFLSSVCGENELTVTKNIPSSTIVIVVLRTLTLTNQKNSFHCQSYFYFSKKYSNLTLSIVPSIRLVSSSKCCLSMIACMYDIRRCWDAIVILLCIIWKSTLEFKGRFRLSWDQGIKITTLSFVLFQIIRLAISFPKISLILSKDIPPAPIASVPQSQLQSVEIETWMSLHPDTPGSRLIHLYREHLHYAHGEEGKRIDDCHKARIKCFAAAQKRSQMKTSMIPTTTYSVHDLLHVDGIYKVPQLGTHPVCLPLILAGKAIQKSGIVVEFGPFAGMTSRCIGIGLNQTGIQHALFSFDTFSNPNNWAVIQKQAKWAEQFAEFDPEGDFVWIWKLVVHSVYPTAMPIKGSISKDVANANVWDNKTISLLSLDSIKDIFQWQDQLEGIKSLKAGSILALMDFTLTDQPTIVYGCLRDYLIPVYTCWDFWEPWIFVVKKELSLRLPCKCLARLQDDAADKMEKKVSEDLDIMGDDSMYEKKKSTLNKLSRVFRTESYSNIRAIRSRAVAKRKVCFQGK
jgi:hypothetical protein